MHRFSLIAIGDELLLGRTINTNAAWIGARIADAGGRLDRVVTIPDDPAVIEATIRSLARDFDVVVTTGGLGPTDDDRTRDVIARMLGADLAVDADQLSRIKRRFATGGRVPNERSLDQARVPVGVTVLHNNDGTAPGMVADIDSVPVVVLPGVPAEMQEMFSDYLTQNPMDVAPAREENWLLTGIPESELAAALEGPESLATGEISVGYLPSHGVVRLRVRATSHATETERTVDRMVAEIGPIVAPYLLSDRPETLDEVVARTLTETSATLAVAESCTGGRIAERITALSGSSRYFLGGVVAYANAVKVDLLGVESSLIESEGAVGPNVAKAMAVGVAKLVGADYAVATTGIAGPTGGSAQKPVGTLYTGVSGPKGSSASAHNFRGSRNTVQQWGTNAALIALLLRLQGT